MAQILQFKKSSFKSLDVPIIRQVEEPTITLHGEAICLNCKHEWKAIVPIGSHEFLCPKCKTEKGAMKYFVDFRHDSYYKCGECDNTLFYLLTNGQNQCPVCGTLLEMDYGD